MCSDCDNKRSASIRLDFLHSHIRCFVCLFIDIDSRAFVAMNLNEGNAVSTLGVVSNVSTRENRATSTHDATRNGDVIRKRSASSVPSQNERTNMTSSEGNISLPVTFMTQSAYLITKMRLYSTFSIQFKVGISRTVTVLHSYSD